MKTWNELTRRGRILRVRNLGIQALQQYDLDVARVRLVGAFTNLALRAECRNGNIYLVRVGSPGWRTDDDIESEMMWLNALKETDIGAPEPVRSRDGRWQVVQHAEGVPEPRRVVVQSWLRGHSMEDVKNLTPKNLYQMGRLFAKLHQFSADFVPAKGFTTRRMNHYLARGEKHQLFSDENLNLFSPNALPVFQQVNEKVLAAFTNRYAEADGLRVIHNDLWHGNIKIYRGHLFPLDFEDTIWGYPIQDIAMAMQDLMTDVAPEAYEPLLAEFRAGYEGLSEWPERYSGEMDLFRAGRVLWVANYVARFQSEHFEGYTQRTQPMLEYFLQTGKLRQQPGPA
jgi:Ser/Thr protein kinase RdoA (MazF antagonist)